MEPADRLVVDGANVVGSRPDGWWRDRAGAAARLHQRLVAAELPYAEVVLVLEGRARAGVPAGRSGRVRTLHAPADGDSAIVALVAAEPEVPTVVVTADRALAEQVRSHVAEVVGPGALLDRLPDPT